MFENKMKDKDFYWDRDNGFLSAYSDDDCCEPLKPQIIQIIDRYVFHIGQSYKNKPVMSVVCKKCGGTQFQVGVDSYFTVIKCVNCEWEMCIHEG